jgi:hypothetical protein
MLFDAKQGIGRTILSEYQTCPTTSDHNSKNPSSSIIPPTTEWKAHMQDHTPAHDKDQASSHETSIALKRAEATRHNNISNRFAKGEGFSKRDTID